LLILALIFAFIDLPEVISSDTSKHTTNKGRWWFLQFPQLSKGTIAIFMYVGAEVTIATFLVILLSESIFPSIASFQAMTTDIANEADKVDKYREIAALYLPYYWGGLMVGRLLGSYILLYVSPNKLLAISACMCMLLVSAFLASSGLLAMYLIIGTGLFLSIMWSNIFTLAIEDLGDYTSQGSGLLVMAIVGGAFIPPVQGYLADMPSIGIQASFAITLVCFAYILYYALIGYKPASRTV
jgi:FHS family L-fucose permease-like MFS transporter